MVESGFIGLEIQPANEGCCMSVFSVPDTDLVTEDLDWILRECATISDEENKNLTDLSDGGANMILYNHIRIGKDKDNEYCG